MNVFKECDDGIYGYNCVNNCSGHCINNSPCNKQTGQCDKGCNPGYTNSKCNKGKYTSLITLNVCVKHTLAGLIVCTFYELLTSTF